jgi:hypothetical protein
MVECVSVAICCFWVYRRRSGVLSTAWESEEEVTGISRYVVGPDKTTDFLQWLERMTQVGLWNMHFFPPISGSYKL